MSLTRIGEDRARYAREVEPRPSRFTNPEQYRAWAVRADTYAAEHWHPASSDARWDTVQAWATERGGRVVVMWRDDPDDRLAVILDGVVAVVGSARTPDDPDGHGWTASVYEAEPADIRAWVKRAWGAPPGVVTVTSGGETIATLVDFLREVG